MLELIGSIVLPDICLANRSRPFGGSRTSTTRRVLENQQPFAGCGIDVGEEANNVLSRDGLGSSGSGGRHGGR